MFLDNNFDFWKRFDFNRMYFRAILEHLHRFQRRCPGNVRPLTKIGKSVYSYPSYFPIIFTISKTTRNLLIFQRWCIAFATIIINHRVLFICLHPPLLLDNFWKQNNNGYISPVGKVKKTTPQPAACKKSCKNFNFFRFFLRSAAWWDYNRQRKLKKCVSSCSAVSYRKIRKQDL